MNKALIITVLIAFAASVLSPTPALAGYKSGGGYFEVKVDGSLKLDPIRVTWLWEPFFDDPFFLDVFARCVRKDQNGNETGKNKVFFKKLTVSSLDSDKVAVFKKQKAKMKAGDTQWKSWDAGFMEPLHADGPALAALEIQVKGKLEAGDRLMCSADISEGVLGFTGAQAAADRPGATGPASTGRLIAK